MSNVIRSNQVLIQNPVETNYKVILEKLIKAKAEIEHYEQKLKEQQEEFKRQQEQNEAFRKEAEEVLEKAKEEAKRIVREAETQAEQIKKEAFEKGFNDGLSQGLAAAEAEYQKRLQEIEILKMQVLAERERILKDAQNELMILVPKIVGKVVEKEARDKEFLKDFIKNAISQLSIKNGLVIRTSEEDFEYVKQNLDEILRGVEGVDKVEIKVDKALSFGDIVIETPYGFVETGIKTRLEKLQEIVFSIIGD
ncbi:ATPase [Caldicellulosiruptor changbaiensis]|uniref:ATPase n=1 Tax=Caldicellulosiruptor changbaiensis TaxID=1222016 RepID=A0A3T0D3B4_9FIRM|nr:ATPase [Caldicellulosiruptor changbaiensis]